jgi:hypothetical protein
MMKARILLMAAACLAACSPQPDKKTDSASASVSEAASVAVPSAASVSSVAAILPAGFVGKWDAPPKPCNTSYRAEMQLDVTPTELSFFESGGTIKSVKVDSPTDVVAEVAMSGEGETWDKSMHMVLTDNGNTLTIDEGKGGIRVRCS